MCLKYLDMKSLRAQDCEEKSQALTKLTTCTDPPPSHNFRLVRLFMFFLSDKCYRDDGKSLHLSNKTSENSTMQAESAQAMLDC